MVHNETSNPLHYIHKIKQGDHQLLEVVLRENLRPTASGERFIANVLSIDKHMAVGKIVVTFTKNKGKLFVGDIYVFNAKIQTHKKPLNPGQFDYGQYLKNKSIHAQVYVGSELHKTGRRQDVWFFADHIRSKMIGRLRNAGFSKDELSVVSALLLGQQQEISPEIIKSYQYAGAVHILSVSGLHIGMIALFIGFVLKPLPNSRAGRLFKMLFIIFCLWGFGSIAGFSPSVVRSVTMFSFLIIGTYLRRGTNIYHTLLVSALLILLVEPSFLLDVGFQLSYAALFFILWLQPLLSSVWSPKNKINQYFWDILTVSFAAQIGTLPLSIYYFHQFPGLFFITNLIIIPWLSVIMALGVLVLFLAAVNLTPQLPMIFLEWSVQILNVIIAEIASYESFLFKNIAMSFSLMILLYLFIASAAIWMRRPTFKLAATCLTIVILVQIEALSNEYIAQTTSEDIILNGRRSTIIARRHGRTITAFSSDRFNEQNHQTIQSYAIDRNANIKNVHPLKNLIQGHKKILIIDSSGVYPLSKADVVLLTQSTKVNVDRLLKVSKPAIVVADASNFNYCIERWKESCIKNKIPFHSTGEKGFYKITE
jgi:competence protein ComEC